MIRTAWLSCVASLGQFENEVAIRGSDFSQNEFSFFASREVVRCEHWPEENEEVSVLVHVEVLAHRDDLYLVKLPGRTFDNGTTITVRTEQMQNSVPEYA